MPEVYRTLSLNTFATNEGRWPSRTRLGSTEDRRLDLAHSQRVTFSSLAVLVQTSLLAIAMVPCYHSPLLQTLLPVLSSHRSSAGDTETLLAHALQKSPGADWYGPWLEERNGKAGSRMQQV